MKNLLLMIALLASSSVFAKNIANYRFAIGSNDWRFAGDATVVSATLTDEGNLTVTRTDSNGQLPEVFEEALNEHTFRSMKWNVIALSNAEIKEEFSQIVCMMMPGPLQSNDHLSVRRGFDVNVDEFLGEVKLVFGPQGCWVSHKVSPAGGREQLAAQILKEQIRTAALEMIKR